MGPDCLTFRLKGDLAAPEFRDWMARHSRKLGVSVEGIRASAHRMEIATRGQYDMLEAFALACSLGPRDVYVETMEIVGPKPMGD
ncbi:MAG: acylphosphatase [Pseudomonadota bacterium]